MRITIAALLAVSLAVPSAAQDDASPATVKKHGALQQIMTQADDQDFVNAKRGKIAEIPDALILDKNGKTVWDRRPYAFLDNPTAPATVNPSLWRQARLNAEHGLFEVVPDKIWQVRGYDISVMTIIRGKTGWIIIDPLVTEEAAAASWKLFTDTIEPKTGKRPITAMLFSHSHTDHFGGVGGIITPEQVAREKIRVIAPVGFSKEATSENILAGPAMARRAQYMFGSLLTAGPHGHVDTGLGAKLSSGTAGYMEPTETVSAAGGIVNIDGLDFDFLDAGGTEAPSEFVFYIPEYRALHTTEVVTQTLHNVLTLRGAIVRDALHWSKVIDAAIQRWGGQANVQLASHSWPTWGASQVDALLASQRNIYRYIHDRTLYLANQGATLHELADQTPEAPIQSQNFSTRDNYGTINHNMKAIYQRYFGWWDGNPANFNPLPPTESAPKYIALMGGPEKALAAGQAALKAGEDRWAAELLGHLVFAQPDNQAARAALASAYDQLGYQSESGAWRNYYLGAAATLRGTEAPLSTSKGAQSRSYITAIPTDVFFDSLATRFDAVKGRAITATFQFLLPDTKEAVAIHVADGVEIPRYGSTAANPTATLTMNRADLDGVIIGETSFPQLIQSGKIQITGDTQSLLGWFTLHGPGNPQFNVVVP